MNSNDYANMCFVIMPFGKKEINGNPYDFDAIFEGIFRNAIEMVQLPDGKGSLRAKRADSPSTPGIITHEMFRDILYSRIVLADITGLNPNVFYELGVRHSLRPTSTVVIKESHVTIPFDVKDLRIFEYDTSDIANYGNAIKTIRTCLEESLKSNPEDSPVVRVLRDDLEWPEYGPGFTKKQRIRSWVELKKEDAMLKEYIRDAEAAVEKGNIEAAISNCKGAKELVPDDLRINMQLGMLLKSKERFEEAEKILKRVTQIYPKYGPAWRELGIVEHKLKKATDAIQTIKTALELNPHDSDAFCSLGGVYKTIGDYTKAQDAYKDGLDKSPHSTYALLNYLTMVTVNTKKLPDLSDRKKQLDTAIEDCKFQIEKKSNLPWCHYDLALIYFLNNDNKSFKEQIEKGIERSSAPWKAKSARDTYTLLDKANAVPEKISTAVEYINELIEKKWRTNRISS